MCKKGNIYLPSIQAKMEKDEELREELDTLWGHLNGHAELLKGILEKINNLENPHDE